MGVLSFLSPLNFMKLVENKNENENSKNKLETIIEEFRIEDFE